MTLPSSGEMKASAINVELNKNATDQISLNDTDARILAQLTTDKSSISYRDFRNRSYYKEIITWANSTIADPTVSTSVTIQGKPSTSFSYYIKYPNGTNGTVRTSTFDANGFATATGTLFYTDNIFPTTQKGDHTLYVTFSGGTGSVKSSPISITNKGIYITTNMNQADIRVLAVNSGWDYNENITVIITSAATLYSDSIYAGALKIYGSCPGGVTIVNKGIIMGMGGTGGIAGSAGNPGVAPGTRGGPGIAIGLYGSVAYSGGPIIIQNDGYIYGGGGGGGGGQGYHVGGGYGYGGGGGGGGAGGGYGGRGGDGDGAGGGAGGVGGYVGGVGGNGSWGGCDSGCSGAGGGGGGRIYNGAGGIATPGGSGNTYTTGNGGGAGGAGGFATTNYTKYSATAYQGGNGGAWNTSGYNGNYYSGTGGGGGGGGGGYGQSGGSGGNGAGGGAGGVAILTGGNSISYSGSGTTMGARSGYW